MSTSTFHRCQHCGYETMFSISLSTLITNSLSVFEENPHCRKCGLSASESDSKMQDELADLMTRNMHLNNNPIQPNFTAVTPPTPHSDPPPTPIAYITQHYHHSTHQKPARLPDEVPASQTLNAAGIDASVLFPSQLQLFKNAPPDQKLRLIELWSIAPPGRGQQMLAKNLGNWPQTNLQQEEEAARQRWESMSQAERNSQHNSHQARNIAEPYMVDGYNSSSITEPVTICQDRLLQSHSNGASKEYSHSQDPVYSSREWWQHMSQTQPMEHQYGMMEQMRINGYGAVDMDGDKDML